MSEPTRQDRTIVEPAVALSVTSRSTVDDLRDLHGWLVDVEDLRDMVDLAASPPGQGKLGGSESVVVALSAGGAVSAFVPVLLSWLRHRTYDVRITIRRPDAEEPLIEFEIDRARDPELARELLAILDQVATETVTSAHAQTATVDE